MKISAEKLGKRFNREWIFKNLNYTFEEGNTYAITGPNGSGKSTLLQVLWGQLPSSTGRLSFENNGSNVPIEDVYNHLSIATPYMDLIDEFTLLEMITFHFKFKKIRTGISHEDLPDRMGLSHALQKPISNFSSGMRQRLKLALAFFSESSIIFLDEPATNLDKKSIIWYQENLAQLPPQELILIASNQDNEYPSNAQKIDLMSLK